MDALEGPGLRIIEAGSGYGKTALAREYAVAAGRNAAHIALDAHERTTAQLFAGLAAGLHTTGLAELAAPIADYDDENGAVSSFVEVLSERTHEVALLVDDVHHLDDDAGKVLARLAREVPHPHTMLLFCRTLPAPLADLSTWAVVTLGGDDLALTSPEVAELCAEGFGVDLEDIWVDALHEATQGWTAAVVLAASRLARADGSVTVIRQLAHGSTLMANLIEELLAELPDEHREALTQFAHLPLLGPAVAPATGIPDLFERSAEAGLTYTEFRDGWYQLAGPVQEHLAGLGPLDPGVARPASDVYRRRQELPEALSVLLAAGDSMSAAKLLADLPQDRVDALDASLIESVVGTLPADAVEQHPRVLLHLARAYEDRAELAALEETLERASRVTGLEPTLAREVDGELARLFVTLGRFDEAKAIANRLPDESGADEVVTRSMALDALGRISAHEMTQESLETAARLLEEAARLAGQARPARWAAQILTHLAYQVHIERGHYGAAADSLDEALQLVPPGTRRRGSILTFRAIALQGLGRFQEAQADLEEARSIGEALADRRIQAYAAWQLAIGVARQGDAATTVSELQTVDRFKGDWYEHPTGLEFLADAVDCASLIEDPGLTEQYMQLLRERMHERSEPNVVEGHVAEAAALARAGDPDDAVGALDALADFPMISPAEGWRIDLLRALAEHRRGRPEAAALAARAFEAAAAAGNPTLPFFRERAAAEALVALAAEAGSRAAVDATNAQLPVVVTSLGSFAVTRGGVEVPLPPGKPEQIVKSLAAAGGTLPSDQLVEDLWPEVEPESGRKRLRNALNRLHSDAGTLVVREGDTLSLADSSVIDAVLFESQARKALAAAPGGTRAAAGLARAALARYRGDFLPGDPYIEWAAETRERLRRLSLSLLDVLVEAAQTRGEVEEAISHLERAIEIERYDESRYVRTASLLLSVERRAAASAVLDRAEAMLDELGLPPSQEILDLRETVDA